MPESLSPQSQMRPLSPGNIVNAAVWLYRSHLKLYSQLALSAHLWLLVPIYGWAKYSATSAMISRLAFNELINQPETISTSRSIVNKRMWHFLGAGILVTFIFIGVFIGLYILLSFALGIGFSVLLLAGRSSSIASMVLGGIFSLVSVVVFFITLIRVYSRYLIVEVPLAVEENINANQAIKRSVDLSTKHFKPIQVVLTIAFVLSIIIQTLIQIPASLIQSLFLENFKYNQAFYQQIRLVLNMGSLLLVGVILMPFWQSIKAALYYDMRLRQEALGFHLPERSDRL